MVDGINRHRRFRASHMDTRRVARVSPETNASAAAVATASRRGQTVLGVRMPPLLRAMRPYQWTKNAIVGAALIFDRRLLEIGPLLHGIAAILCFCAVSSAIYLVNDLRDVEADKVHPVKRFRPIAAGELSPAVAALASGVLMTMALAGAALVELGFLGIIAGYAALMIAYSAGLKRMVILDVFAIAAGFVLRAAGGAVAIDVPVSPWLYVCTLLLALFIGFGKRRHELTTLEGAAGRHRANLDAYSVPLLDQLIGIVASATVMAYSIYTFDASSVPRNHAMMLTIPFVAYAIFRYLYLIHRRDLGGSPEILLFSDRPLLACIVGWGLASIGIIYLWT